MNYSMIYWAGIVVQYNFNSSADGCWDGVWRRVIKPQMEIRGQERGEREVKLEISLERLMKVLLLAGTRQEALAVVVCSSIPIMPKHLRYNNNI